jgi:hypothetical protein
VLPGIKPNKRCTLTDSFTLDKAVLHGFLLFHTTQPRLDQPQKKDRIANAGKRSFLWLPRAMRASLRQRVAQGPLISAKP